MNYEVMLIEKNYTGEIVREKSLMKSAHKQRALSFFNEEVIRITYYLKPNTQVLLLEHSGDESKVIRTGNR